MQNKIKTKIYITTFYNILILLVNILNDRSFQISINISHHYYYYRSLVTTNTQIIHYFSKYFVIVYE